MIQTTYETLPQAAASLLDSADAWNRASTAAVRWAGSLRGAAARTVRLLLGNVPIK